jgi:hypothetical protein
MLSKIKRVRQLLAWASNLELRATTFDLPARADYKHPKVLTGTILSAMNLERKPRRLRDIEFQVFSQFGDDGIIQYLVHSLPIGERTFVEFGVEDYTESNTRFLLVKDKWSGLVLDGNEQHIAYIRADRISRLFDLRAQHAFISADNINELLVEAGFTGKIGLLSIDVDGVDYWIWKAITCVDPAIVVIEYNANFGAERAITVPYDAKFARERAHPSLLYWGASLKALQELAQNKGYVFVGCNANGNNAYFLRVEYATHPAIANLEAEYHPAVFAEYEVNGQRLRGTSALEVVRGLPIYNISTSAPEVL